LLKNAEYLRIAITADPYVPVPPLLYGGIERVIDFLVRGLIRHGHQVTLIAHPESRVRARLIGYGRPPHVGWLCRFGELTQVGGALWRERASFDIVHSFGRLAALLPILPIRTLPKIQSYQRDVVPWQSVGRAVRLAGPSLVFTGCSSSVYQRRSASSAFGDWQTVFNGVDVERYTARREVAADAPLMFLGRLEPVKGAHHAIDIARRAGRRLVIAGNTVSDAAGSYFAEAVAPHVDGNQIVYVGPVDDIRKNELLGAAAALLMPIDWDEPFGIVMAEAFACGTPVIAFQRGSVPEVVRTGVNGFACRTVAEAAAAVDRLGEIDRAIVRADCEKRFGAEAIVDQYLNLYHTLIDRVAELSAQSAA
jgi:glycosyltransferase involved in cell wall biosynthesis